MLENSTALYIYVPTTAGLVRPLSATDSKQPHPFTTLYREDIVVDLVPVGIRMPLLIQVFKVAFGSSFPPFFPFFPWAPVVVEYALLW